MLHATFNAIILRLPHNALEPAKSVSGLTAPAVCSTGRAQRLRQALSEVAVLPTMHAVMLKSK